MKRSILIGLILGLSCQIIKSQEFPIFSDRTAERISRTSNLTSRLTTFAEADYDNDGQIDLVVEMISSVGVVLMNRDGVLVEEFTLPANINAEQVFAADINGDGFDDVLVAAAPRNAYFENLGVDGNGKFLGFADVSSRLPELSSNAVSAADIDGDGDNDILFAAFSNRSRDSILLNNGDNTFTNVADRLEINWNSLKGRFIDLNSDGAPDILRQHNDDFNQIDYNNGDGTFTSAGSLPQARAVQRLAYTMVDGDFNADGLPDIVSLNDGIATYTFSNGLDANGHTLYTTQGFTWPDRRHQGHFFGESGDIDNDGDIDFVITGTSFTLIEA